MIGHQAKSMNINKQLSWLFINTTTCDVVEFGIDGFLESPVTSVYYVIVVEFKEIVDKAKVVLVVHENFSFIHAAI